VIANICNFNKFGGNNTDMTVVNFYNALFAPPEKLTYSVIAARFGGKWIFVRHNDRSTWEIAGGHIEPGESPDDAARRELMEETGAKEFIIECVAAYSVEKEGSIGFGRLYFAQVTRLGDIPDISEIAGISLGETLPENLTYPDIQPHLFNKVLEYLNSKEKEE
jgi:8-oxo-dGTP diphosphatase